MENCKVSDRAPENGVEGLAIHPSVRALMEEAHAGETAEDVIRRKCREKVGIGKRAGWSGPPFDPFLLASILGIKVSIEEHAFPGEGYITGYQGRAFITIRPGTTLERQRFTLCHEIAHTCFPDVFEMGRSRGVQMESVAEKKFEALCDVGAAELLMPLDEFRRDLGNHRVSIDLAERLSSSYGASMEATIRRILGLTNQRCAAVFMTDGRVAEHIGNAGIHRIRSFTPSTTFGVFAKPGTIAPQQSCVYKAAKDVVRLPVPERWVIEDVEHAFNVEAVPLPDFPDAPKVLAILHRD